MSTRQPKDWTPERHEACKAREKAATPRPWRRWQQPESVSCDWKDALPPGSICLESTGTVFALGVAVAAFPGHGDADFTEHARDDVLDMLAKIEEQTTEIERLEASELDLIRKAGETATRDDLTIQSLTAEVEFYKRREQDICDALGGVGDGGKYRNDIIDVIRARLRPEGPLTEGVKRDIHKAFANLCGSGVPEDHLARMHADHAIGLLENQRAEWFTKEPKR